MILSMAIDNTINFISLCLPSSQGHGNRLMSRTSKASKAGEDTATRITLLPVYAQCKKTSNCAPDLVCEHSTHQCKKQLLAACRKSEECAYNRYCDHGQCKKGPEVICRKGRWE